MVLQGVFGFFVVGYISRILYLGYELSLLNQFFTDVLSKIKDLMKHLKNVTI